MYVDPAIGDEFWVTAYYPEKGIHIGFTEGVEGDRSKPRRYMVNGKKWPSATTIIDKHFSRDGLAFWHENVVVQGMVDLIEEATTEHKEGPIGKLPTNLEDARRALWMIGATGEQVKKAAGLDGDTIHKALEAWFLHKEVPSLAMVQEEKRGKMQALAAFLSETRPDILSSEVLICSPRYRYAGRPDARIAYYKPTVVPVQMTSDPDSVEYRTIRPGVYLGDVKSGRRLHPEVGIQLALYEQGCREMGYQRTQGRFAIHLREDGTYALRFYNQRLRTATQLVEFYYANMEDNKRSTAFNKKLERVA